MNRRRRLLAIGVLLAVGMGLCVHYGATYDDAWPHPTGDQLEDDSAGWDGERVLLFGEIQERTASGLVMTIENDAGEVVRTVSVSGATVDVAPGGVVQVSGELSERGTEQKTDSVVVVNEDSSDHTYKLVTSMAGVMLAAGFFLRYWGIDWRGLGFVRRRGERNG